MDGGHRYPLLNKDYVLVRQYDESIIYPLSNNSAGIMSGSYSYEYMNKQASEILELCDGKNSLADIAARLANHYKVPAEDALRIVREFILVCKDKNYLSLSEDIELDSTVRVYGNYEMVSPLRAVFEVTKRCPLNCLHCFNNSGVADKTEVSTAEAQKIIDRLSMLGIQKIMLTGGEPTVRDDFLSLLNYAYDKFVAISIGSNGYFIDEQFAQSLSGMERKLVFQISLDGNEENHNRIRRNSQSFARVIKAISALTSCGIMVSVAMTLNEHNVNDIDIVADYAHRLGAMQLTFGRTINLGRAKENRIGQDFDMDGLYDKVLRVKKEYLAKGLYVNLDEETERAIDQKTTQCGAGITQICVRENGDVSPCISFNYVYGNLVREKPEDIFRPETVDAFRSISNPLMEECEECRQAYTCAACKAVAYDIKDKQCRWYNDFASASLPGRGSEHAS